MNPEDQPTKAPAPAATKLLRCNSCGTTLVPSDAEFFDFVRRGWPHCCGETMALFLEAVRPTSAPEPKR